VGALTKRKYSHARQGERRAHLALQAQTLVECPQCHKAKRPHTVCSECGYYNGVQVITPKTKKDKKNPSA
jgi:large subunit ribosomal protein L32